MKSMGLPLVHACFVLGFATFNALARSSFSSRRQVIGGTLLQTRELLQRCRHLHQAAAGHAQFFGSGKRFRSRGLWQTAH
jgi:hypothetical protein